MEINEFIAQYKTYPVLFIGTGFSKRYLEDIPDWDGLLEQAAKDLWGNTDKYKDLKEECRLPNGLYNFPKIGSKLNEAFTNILREDDEHQLKEFNRKWYDLPDNERQASRLKLYISDKLEGKKKKEEDKIKEEISSFKKCKEKICSIITTNYDTLLEDLSEFKPLIGNKILLSDPLRSIYKIHGYIKSPMDIVLTEEDYTTFNEKYDLIRAQLISLFIHNPIIFLGYSLSDENIKKVLQTIFSYVVPDSELSKQITSNFLLVEYSEGEENTIVENLNLSLGGNVEVTIKQIKTDNYTALYRAIASLDLPISMVDQKRIREIVRGIEEGGTIKVNIAKDWEQASASDRIIAIGSQRSVSLNEIYDKNDILQHYFEIIEGRKISALSILKTLKPIASEFFPAFGFWQLTNEIEYLDQRKDYQISKLKKALSNIKPKSQTHNSIDAIIADSTIAKSYQSMAILEAVYKREIDLDSLKSYLQGISWEELQNSEKTEIRKLLCLYDIMKYAPDTFTEKLEGESQED